jgi:hypothetical protein
MTWSKRSRLQMAVAVAVGLTAVLCIAVAIGTWKATNNNQNGTTGASDLDLFTSSPTESPIAGPTLSPSITQNPLPSPSPAPPPTPLPTLASPAPTMHPTSQPTNVPTRSPTRSPTKAPTRLPTLRPTLSPTANARIGTSDQTLTTFYAIADAPYDQNEARQLPIQIRALPSDAEFLVHLGDIRSARNGGPCKLYEYTDVATILRQSPVPVFIVVGDNEYNDCTNVNAAFGHWNSTFRDFENQWDHSFGVIRPADHEECFAFFHKKTLFIGLNLVGGRVQSSGEWQRRLSWQVQWTKSLILQYTQANAVVILGHANPTVDHSDFFTPLKQFIQNRLMNRIPILYMNGDAHAWHYEPKFFGQSNFLRIQLTGSTIEPPLKAMVNASAPQGFSRKVFTYDRRLN